MFSLRNKKNYLRIIPFTLYIWSPDIRLLQDSPVNENLGAEYDYFNGKLYLPMVHVQSNFNGSNTFGTIKISSRQG